MSAEPTAETAATLTPAGLDGRPHCMIGCRGVTKTFPGTGGDFVALGGVDLDIAPDEFITVLGPSGCGKSTLLNLIAGFDLPTAGTVSVAGSPVTGPSPDKGVVFQDFALFPWLTVRKNIAYGLREKRLPKAEIREIVDAMLDTVGLERVADHYPHQLSGGMKQRVSIARVLAIDPRILLLDEPFGALDEQRRSGLQDELLRIWQQRRKTAVFITHSVEEAIVLGDRVVVIAAAPGRVTAVVDVTLERPRDRTSDAFNALRREVTAHLWS